MASTNITTFPGKVGVSNANPTHTLSIGSNVFVDDTGTDKLVVTGSIGITGGLSGDGAGLSNVQTSNVIGLSDNVARIGTLKTDLSDNSSRITSVESGAHTFTGIKIFEDDIILESNLRVRGDLLVANTVNMTVSDPIIELGSNNLNTGDIGFVMTRHGASESNVTVFYDETEDRLKIGYTLNSANDTVLALDSNALPVDIQGELTVGSNLEVGTANLFVDTTTSNVGIGTDAPAYTLDIHGTANVNTINVNTIQGLQTMSFSSDSTTVPPLQLTASSLNDGVGALRIDSVEPDVFLNDTDGGFSTVTLANNGVSRAAFGRNNGDDFYITVRDPATNGGNWRDTSFVMDSSSGNVSMAHSLEVGTANLFVDTATGSVGVGTTSPDSALSVTGDRKTSAPSAAGIHMGMSGTNLTQYASLQMNATDQAQIDFSSPGTDADGRITYNITDGDMYFKTNGTDNRMIIDSSGNVGIGTTSPSSLLTVNPIVIDRNTYDHSEAPLTVTHPTPTANATLNDPKSVLHLARQGTNSEAFGARASFKLSRYENNGYDSRTRLDLNLAHASYDDAHVMTIRSDGNVGIGTTSPIRKFDSRSGIGNSSSNWISGVFGGTGVYPRVVMGALSSVACIGAHDSTLNAWDTLYLNDPTHAVCVNGGKLGIGTTSPAQKFHIHNDDEYVYQRFTTTASSTTDTFDIAQWNSTRSNGDHGVMFINRANTDMRFVNNDAEVMRLKNNGNVGIGTASPLELLDIKKSSSDNFIRIQAGGAASFHGGIQFTENGIRYGWRQFYDAATDNLVISTQNNNNAIVSNVMTMTYGGNVGIGTSSPDCVFESYSSGGRHKITRNANNTNYGGALDFALLNSSNAKKTYARIAGSIYDNTVGSEDGFLSFQVMTAGTLDSNYGQEKMRITHTGFVGLGTDSPSYRLHILNGDNSITWYGPNTTWGGYLAVGAASDKTSSSYTAQVISTNGNLHLDAGTGRDMYLNYYDGNYVRYGSGATTVHSSDDRLKTQEELIENATDTLMKLRPQKYLKSIRLPEDGDTREPILESGLIVQDLWYDAPELRHLVKLADDANPSEEKPPEPVPGDIQQDPDYSDWGTMPAALSYIGLIPYLIKSNQELKLKNDALEARITALENA